MPGKCNAGFCAGLAMVIAAGGLGCGATAPDNGDSYPIRYDITSSALTYSYPDPQTGYCSSMVSCPHKTVASTNSSLSGTIVLSVGRPVNSGNGTYGIDDTSLSEVDCGAGTSCRSRVVSYTSNGFAIAADTLSRWASFFSDGEYVYLKTGRIAGDSITGTFYWATFSGVASTGYGGDYVARRRR